MNPEIKELLKEKLVYEKDLLKKLKIRVEKYEGVLEEEEKETLFAAMAKFCEEIVETAIKINTKLLEEKDDFAMTYRDSFKKLSKYYSLDNDFIEKLANTTGFRNRISHEYSTLDEKITQRSIERLLEIYDRYVFEINSILETKDI